MQVNFLGLIAALNLAKPLLKKATGRAQICVVSSLATAVAFPRNEMYGASKAALIILWRPCAAIRHIYPWILPGCGRALWPRGSPLKMILLCHF